MIVPHEELINYLGNELNILERRVKLKTFRKLKQYEEQTQRDFGYSAIDYLFLEHQKKGRSILSLSEELGISDMTLGKVFEIYGLPRLNNTEAVGRETLQRWRQDPEFRERNAKGVRRELHERWQDPIFKAKQANANRTNWKDPKFRERNAEGVRRARLNPENIGKYKLPTIYGYRSDIGFEAQSTWEANFGRILLYLGREFHTRKNFRLIVPAEFRELFKSDEIEISIDFVVRDPRGNIVLYEIMAQPSENKQGYAKLEMLIQQYDTNLRMINQRFYNRLLRYFKKKIESHPNLSGWETSRDNLRTNPEKYK